MTLPPYLPLTVLTVPLDLETRCALAEMASAGSVEVVQPSLREQILLNFAIGATKGMYGGKVPTNLHAVQNYDGDDLDPLDLNLSVTYTPTLPAARKTIKETNKT